MLDARIFQLTEVVNWLIIFNRSPIILADPEAEILSFNRSQIEGVEYELSLIHMKLNK